ncbi:MAG TPA: Trp biosynthesis-associated membrane protein [Mycobacteriales bacterium]|nr:Trp biosynthesis-associated membrane protein [Mycobacteriales bacterium]
MTEATPRPAGPAAGGGGSASAGGGPAAATGRPAAASAGGGPGGGPGGGSDGGSDGGRRGMGARELGAVVGACALGGGMVLFSVGPTWLRVSAQRRPPLADVTLSLSGRTLEPLVAGLGIVGLAGVVGLLATRRWGRLVVAAIVAASGIGVVVTALTRLAAPGQAELADLLQESDRGAGLAADPAISATASPGWPLLAAAGGLLLALGGLAALARSRHWPTMSARYDTPAARAQRPRTDAAVWDALSRGDDPTTADPPPADPTTADPTAADPTAADPTTADPTTADPTTTDPPTADPTAAPADRREAH